VETETCKKELVIEIPVEVVRRETQNVTSQYQRIARIPGFRPGHAPASLVRTRFRKDIESDVVQSLVPKFFETAIRDQNLTVVGQPRFDGLKFEEDQPLTCKASFEIYPQFELKDYKGLTIEEEAVTVEGPDIEKALEKLREGAAAFEVVGERAATDDDFLIVSYKGYDLTDPKSRSLEAREAMVHIGGKGTVAAFSENLRGTRAGETREFEVTYPGDYPQKTLAGKTYRYRVEIQSIKRKVLPAVDDELAKSVSAFQTLGELKQKIREDLLRGREHSAVGATKAKLLEELVELHAFPVPEALVEEQLDRKLESTLTRLLAQGIDPRTVDVDWRKIREESRPDAMKEVCGSIILERIAEAEKIEVTEEEVDEVIREMAQERHEAPATLKTRLTRDGVVGRIKFSRRSQKALDLIYRSAKIIRKNEVPGNTPEG
jgi:trigger factor